jgi:uncharacterized protein YbbC (DUF1343 family)
VGIEIATVLKQLHPANFDVAKLQTLIGNADTIGELQSGAPAAEIVRSWSVGLAAFEKIRTQYFLYQ